MPTFIPKEQIEFERLQIQNNIQSKTLSDNCIVCKTEGADETDFRKACDIFKRICGQIGELLGYDFYGGDDEILALEYDPKFETDELNRLFTRLQYAESYCRRQASKLGVAAPEWWYKCWGLTRETAAQLDRITI